MSWTIHRWRRIADDFTDKLLLGNGSSIAVWPRFRYESLYDMAQSSSRIGVRLRQLFRDFGTIDFEYVLRLLSETRRVNEILGITDRQTASLYGNLRDALVQTVTDIHPTREQVQDKLLPIADFMKQFNTVLSLNYDLVVYWAMLTGNDQYGQWFKDGFVNAQRFENDFDYLYQKYGTAEGATLVFYPHGNLILATEVLGDEVKLSSPGQVYLLTQILSAWEDGSYIPLFVSEGSSHDKLRAIRRSNYLDTVYDYAVSRPSDSLVIYGWSFRDEDEHILRALIEGKPRRIAVSVHGHRHDADGYCDTIEFRIKAAKTRAHDETEAQLYFFDSDSDGCWMH